MTKREYTIVHGIGGDKEISLKHAAKKLIEVDKESCAIIYLHLREKFWSNRVPCITGICAGTQYPPYWGPVTPLEVPPRRHANPKMDIYVWRFSNLFFRGTSDLLYLGCADFDNCCSRCYLSRAGLAWRYSYARSMEYCREDSSRVYIIFEGSTSRSSILIRWCEICLPATTIRWKCVSLWSRC